MYRTTDPLRRVSVLLFFALISTSVFGQTTIRERVEIQPRVQQSVVSHSSSSSVLHQVDATKAAVSLPGVTLTVTGVSVSVPSLPFPSNNVAGLYLELRVDASGGGAFPLKRYFVCEGNVTEQGFSLPTLDLSSCGQVYVLYKVISWSGFARCHPRESPYKFALASVGGTGGTFTIQDTVFNAFSAPVPVSATVTVAAGLRPGFEVAQLAVLPGKTTLQCTDNTPVNVTLKNASGQTVTICSGTTLQATASLEGVGPYAFLRQGTQEGQTIRFPVTASSFSFTAVLDTSRGVIPLGNRQATLRVTVEGVEGTANINLTCPYPPPAVTITHPAQDTTIVLTQNNQPLIILKEEHSPTSGKFEPVISWQPSQTMNTAEYFEQIEDGLVIVERVTATNIAGMIATDSVKITLKKNVLDSIIVIAVPDTIEPAEASVIRVIAKDVNKNDLILPGDTPVQVSLDMEGASLGKLESPSRSGSSIIATWEDVHSGNVKYIALDEPLPPPATKVSSASNGVTAKMAQTDEIRGRAVITAEVTHQGVTKSNSDTVVVKEPIKINLSLDRETLYPTLTSMSFANEGGNNKTQVFMRLTRGDQPVSNQDVEIKTEPIIPSGGHEGHPVFPDNQRGTFFWNGKTGNPLTVTTNEGGEVANLLYTTGEFSVKMRFIAKHKQSRAEKTLEKQISVAALTELTGSSFDLKHIENEVQRKHPRPYWVVPGIDLSLELIATGYNRLFPDGPRLVATDASLQNGGRYEIHGNWTHRSHFYHRIGLDVDLRSRDILDDQFSDDNGNGFFDPGEKLTVDHNKNGKLDLHRTKLEEILKKRVPRPRFEPTKKDKEGKIIVVEHYHLYFWNE
ncbi:MAG TPA: hypothetical protein VNL36_04390 [Bacteroidota bacterium]|nr:hypothetical protein [Bacteroidota bacterium]